MPEEKSEEPKETQQVSWNLAEYIIQTIATLINQSAQHNATNNFSESMSCLKAIRFVIPADFSNDEKSSLDKIEIGFYLSWSKAQPQGFNLTDFKELSKAYLYHKKYAGDIMSLLKKYGYYVPLKRDKSAMGG